ncbi:MAG: YaaR family protein [Firmicutes bacterium]|nr:YaaR family protein [Bacillota bacterium]
MEIKRVGRRDSSPRKKKAAAKVNLKHSVFFATLQEYEAKDAGGSLEDFIAAVDEAAQNLLKERTIANLRRYREAVREFMKKVVAGSYQIKGSRRWDRRGNRKVLYLIEKVNHSLEGLAAMVLKKQADTMKVMAALDEIRGLLLDLYY